MGSFSHFTISDFVVTTDKNSCSEEILNLLFQKDDYIEESRALSLRNKTIWGDQFLNEEGSETIKVFRSTCKVCIERLKIFGASFSGAKHDFNYAICEMIDEGMYTFEDSESISYEYFLSILQEIINGTSNEPRDTHSNFKSYIRSYLAPDGFSLELFLFSVLSLFDENCVVEYDLTDVINGGWVAENVEETLNPRKNIVLTEGKTDSEFLSSTLDLLFPHLRGYYHFMDFESSKYEANASRLVQTIKAFVGSGIESNIIALFDNDGAAIQEMENLKHVVLPDNIKVIRYPDISIALEYPTIGPSGPQVLDVNGYAASIELYLGKDVLTVDGEYLPVQWSSYLDKIKRYQGVIQNKNSVQDRFREKVRNYTPESYQEENWVELLQIMDAIFTAWTSTQGYNASDTHV